MKYNFGDSSNKTNEKEIILSESDCSEIEKEVVEGIEKLANKKLDKLPKDFKF